MSPETGRLTMKRLDFMQNRDGSFREGVEYIPYLREYIAERDESVETWTLAGALEDVDVHPNAFVARGDTSLIEYAGAWPVPDHYQNAGPGKRFAVPNRETSKRYCDIVIECGCGATFTKGYAVDIDNIEGAHDHTDDCTIQQRLRARARLAERRAEVFARLLEMGWDLQDITYRVDLCKGGISRFVDKYGVDVQERKRVYHERLGNTYVLLQRDGYSAEEAQDILDVSCGYASRLVRRYGDFEYVGGKKPASGRWVETSG